MKIPLDKRKKLYLESYSHGFMIVKYSGKKDKEGKETYQILSYARSMPEVAKQLYNIKLIESTATTIEELLRDHKQIIKEIRELFRTEGLINE